MESLSVGREDGNRVQDIVFPSLNIKKTRIDDKTVIEYGEIVQSEKPHTCFIIPGAFSTAQTWEQPAGALMRRNRGQEFGKLVCVTPFGMNGSSFDETAFNAQRAYRCFINENSPKGDLTVIVHSKADENALFLCNYLDIKNRLKRLIVVSPIMTVKGDLIKLIIKSVRSLKFFSDLPGSVKIAREAIKTSPAGVLHHAFTTKEVSTANMVNFFREIDVPVLVVGSENDIAAEAELKEFANYFPHADVKIMKDGGHHFPFYHPEEFADAIWDWIESQYKIAV